MSTAAPLAPTPTGRPARSARFRRLALFGTVYFTEGAVLTFFSAFNILYLRSFDISYTKIGLMMFVTLIPFILKVFIGILSDGVSLFGLGHRRPYMVLGLVLQAVPFLCIPLVDPAAHFGLYLGGCLVAALGMSTYDTTTDGLSIDLTPPEERGLVQGVMVGGRALSAVVIAAVLGFLAGKDLWPAAFILVGALALLTIPLVLAVDEPRTRPAERRISGAAFRSFLSPAFVLFITVGLLYPMALYSANSMISAFLNEKLGVALGTVGLYVSVFGIGTVAGALGGGPLVKRIGRRKSVLSALLLTSVVITFLALVPSAGLAWAVVFLFGVAFGYYETVYMAMGMDFSDPRIAAFMFSIIMAFGNIGIAAGAPIAGVLVDRVGFGGMFLALAAINLLALPLVLAVFRLRKDLD